MEPAQGWSGWYQERMAPLYRLYRDEGGWEYEDNRVIGEGDPEFDFEFDEGEY